MQAVNNEDNKIRNTFAQGVYPYKKSAYNPYKCLGKILNLSDVTIRTAMSCKPVTWQTARTISNFLTIPLECFVIKCDNRGQHPIKRKKTNE